MGRSKFTTQEQAKILKEGKAGNVEATCKKYDISVPTFYLWNRKLKNVSTIEVKEETVSDELTRLKEENMKLKAELAAKVERVKEENKELERSIRILDGIKTEKHLVGRIS